MKNLHLILIWYIYCVGSSAFPLHCKLMSQTLYAFLRILGSCSFNNKCYNRLLNVTSKMKSIIEIVIKRINLKLLKSCY